MKLCPVANTKRIEIHSSRSCEMEMTFNPAAAAAVAAAAAGLAVVAPQGDTVVASRAE
jgi:hypothetical protein